MNAVVAPSDLLAGRVRARSVRLGGRVLLVRARRLTLGDALGSVEIALREPTTLGPGDLVVVAGRREGRRVVDAVVVERRPLPEPRGDGELARFIWQGVGPRLVARARALQLIRARFVARGFVEVDAPLRVPTPGLDLHVDAFRSEDCFLSTSPEFQLKRLLVGGMPRVFSLAHCFRAGEHGAQHEPEFLMLEWYRAFAGQDEIIADTEQIVEAVVRELASRPRIELPSGLRIDVRAPFLRVRVRDAFKKHAGVADAVDLAESDPDRYFELLVARVEPALAKLRRPVFLCDYPLSQASLAQPSPSDPRVAERFELYLGGVELCNGFGELTDPVEQRRRFRAEQKQRRQEKRPVYALDERFLAALDEGMPAAGGNALGVDRLIALALGVDSIADVQAFPRGVL